MLPLSFSTLQKLRILGVSTLGIHQLAAGVPVTESRDRDLLAQLIAGDPRRPNSLAQPRAGWEKMLRSGSPEDRRRIAQMLEFALSRRRSA